MGTLDVGDKACLITHQHPDMHLLPHRGIIRKRYCLPVLPLFALREHFVQHGQLSVDIYERDRVFDSQIVRAVLPNVGFLFEEVERCVVLIPYRWAVSESL